MNPKTLLRQRPLQVDERLVDIGDELTDYEDDVEHNSFNIFRGTLAYVCCSQEAGCAGLLFFISLPEYRPVGHLSIFLHLCSISVHVRKTSPAEVGKTVFTHTSNLGYGQGIFQHSRMPEYRYCYPVPMPRLK